MHMIVYEIFHQGDSLFFFSDATNSGVRPIGLWHWSSFDGTGETVSEIALALISQTLRAVNPECVIRHEQYKADPDQDDAPGFPVLLADDGHPFEESTKAYEALIRLTRATGCAAITSMCPVEKEVSA